MIKFWTFLFLATILIRCGNKAGSECNCCISVYSDISVAKECIKENPSEISSDNRLLLLTFSKSEVKDWSILKDPEIISVAKKNYLLIHLDEMKSNFLKRNATPELLDILKKHQSEKLFFVITNQVLYPFADWNNQEQKEIIIDRLNVGNGP